MSNLGMFSEDCHVVQVLIPLADRFDATAIAYTDIVSLKNHNHAAFVVSTGANSTGNMTLTMYKCTSTTGAGSTAIAYKYKTQTTAVQIAAGTWSNTTAATATGFVTSSTGTNMAYIVEVNAAALAGSEFLRMGYMESTDAAVTGAVLAVLTGTRYQGDAKVSPLS